MYLKVGSKKSSIKLGIYPNLVAQFCGPFEILDRIGHVAYALAFLSCMHVHNVFHVSLLKKSVYDPNHIIYWDLIKVEPEGYISVQPLCTLDQKVTLFRNRAIGQIKVQWTHYSP